MRRAVITFALLAAPRAALACPVCFGQNDSPLAVAMNQGILMMLGVVALVLGAFASFFIVLIRRAKAAELAASAAAVAGPAEAGHYLGSQEGTAQC
jgi:hypothetical protein